MRASEFWRLCVETSLLCQVQLSKHNILNYILTIIYELCFLFFSKQIRFYCLIKRCFAIVVYYVADTTYIYVY